MMEEIAGALGSKKDFALNIAASVALATMLTSLPHGLAQGSHKQFNVKTYGAKGDGVTDDSTAIQAALVAAGTKNGAVVFFPAGTYLYSQTIVADGITIQGANASSTTLLSNGAAAFVEMQGTNPTVTSIAFQNLMPNTGASLAVHAITAQSPRISANSFKTGFFQSIYLENCTDASVTGNSLTVGQVQAQAEGLYAVNATRLSIAKNSFDMPQKAVGLQILNSNSVSIIGNSFNRTFQGVSPSAYPVSLVGSGQLTISSNTFKSNAPTNHSSAAIRARDADTALIESNSIANFKEGITVFAGKTITISNNNLTNRFDYGIDLRRSNNASLSENTVNTVTAGLGISLASNTGIISATDNQIRSTGEAAIYSAPNSSNQPNSANLTVTGNAIVDAGLNPRVPSQSTAVIYVNQSQSTSVTVTGNQYEGNTSNLSYFIEALQALSKVSGNKTKTTLPTKVGP